MKHILWILVLLLLILHQDYWQWHRSDIVFGFVPYALAYHIFVSIATAAVWIVAVTYFWPENVDDIKPLNKPAKKTAAQLRRKYQNKSQGGPMP